MTGWRFIQINSLVCDAVFAIVLGVFRVYKLLGRTETRTRDRICSQSIRTVSDIFRDDRAIIATWSLLTCTDIFKENYSIDIKLYSIFHNEYKAFAFIANTK